MLITTFVTIKISSNLLSHYREKGYIVNRGDYLTVKPSDLSSGSICDNPDCKYKIVKSLSYKDYFKATKNNQLYYCTKCSYIKAHQTCIDRYGDLYTRTDICKEQFKNTCIEKFGYANPFQSPIIKEEIRLTNLENLGVEYPMQNKDIYLKGVETLKSNYNVDSPLKSSILVSKSIETKRKRYGKSLMVNRPKHYLIADPDYLKIRKIERESFTKLRYETILDNNYSIIDYTDKCFNIKHLKCSNIFKISKDLVYSRTKLNVEVCTICNPIDTQQSWGEKEVINFIDSLCV